jgi:nucleoside-diphosphate-sugar epimerase
MMAMQTVLPPSSNVLITGTTGLIGGEIFRRLCTTVTEGTIWPLIRPMRGEDPLDRLHRRLGRSGDSCPIPANVRPLGGDISEPEWGLCDRDLAEVTDAVDMIVHNAAETSFSPQNGIVKTNVSGVRRLIELAQKCARPPLIVYMSTASNVGDVTGCCVGEDDGCRPENHHFNEYTQSKAVAERLLRSSGLPVLTLRPTIVLSADLFDAQFARQILWFAPVTRFFRALPIDPASRLDLVDVGFVADAAVRLMEAGSRSHQCYHLSAGVDHSLTIAELLAMVDRFYNRKTPLQLIPPSEWNLSSHRRYVRTEVQRTLYKSIRYYLPFLNMDTVYDNRRLEHDLGSLKPAVRHPEEYIPALLRLIRTRTALREAALP